MSAWPTRDETGGLLDAEAIEALMADELGLARPNLSKLSELSPDAQVSAECLIDEIEPPRTFKSGDRSGRFRRLRVSDGSAKMTLMLWDEEVGLVEQLGLHTGSRIKILSAVLKNTRYGPQIHVGRNGFIILEEVAPPPAPPVSRDIKDMESGRVIARGVLVSFSVFGRGKNRSAIGRLFDGTGEAEVLFSEMLLESLSRANAGTEIEISGAQVVLHDGRRQLVCDGHSSVRIL